ncbi:FdhF/YdeP family oxidoreductase [Williamsia sterculiae]|uniref:Oxidoreductase alpha (Molybdopterin) subunit n=1 Tax=Williamsia sterculiae TaxID=1344003 RepID=A0A1N7H3H9_9NOCA|nr:FdhF/YdeP family oxidoreductase [Williamsia sterculiae]SIS19381.1 oxidoreductase alpha (molybdopterin) subunit [Williamsia sterculiae]
MDETTDSLHGAKDVPQDVRPHDMTEHVSPASAPTQPGPASRVPGLLPITPRQGGYGPVTDKPWSQHDYHHPAAGWGAAMSVGHVLLREHELLRGSTAMLKMNHPVKGFDCPGCAWPDDQHGLKLDLCENGVKHTTWEMTKKRAGREFFARHSVTELAGWTDFDLENQGRLTEPMVYDADTDHYVPIGWDDAFRLVGTTLQNLPSPDLASFYTSGRLSNEATWLYQLMARELGTNNLPDCSNMCHEASGRALKAAIGTGKGTCDLEDWDLADAIFILGVNASSNAPRMLTSLAEATKRGAQVIHVNTFVEAAETRTIVPHDILDMATFRTTDTSTGNVQVRPGGDLAMLRAIAKGTLEAAAGDPTVLDADFLADKTHGFDEYRSLLEATSWDELVRESGVSQKVLRKLTDIYLRSERTVISWCLGVSQHEHGVDTAREIVNLLLLRGNIGRPGAGPSPVRGHSNVQGNRTCGIDHNPSDEFLDKLSEVCNITAPRTHGLDTVKSIKAMNEGKLTVFIGMGGNFVLAAPDTRYTARGMRKLDLTVQVSTKLNRSHLVHGKQALILPCLTRTEKDMQSAGPQGVTVEDAMAMVHLSVGKRRPASSELRSEPAIIAGMARAALPDSPTPWEWLVRDYDRIRDVMAAVLPGFEGFNHLIRDNHLGFRIPQPARERDFRTESGRAEFSLAPLPKIIPDDPEVLVLQTMRSHDQWNTTIYSNNDRYRGVKNLRELIFMNTDDMADRGIDEGEFVDIACTSVDGSVRSVSRYRAVGYNTPRGSAAGYMPEMNMLMGPLDFSSQSDQPLMKSLQVKVTPTRSEVSLDG